MEPSTHQGLKRVCKAIAEEVAARDLKLIDLAGKAQLNIATVSDLIHGPRRWPHIRTLNRIEQALGWQPGILVQMMNGHTDVPTPAEPANTRQGRDSGPGQDMVHDQVTILRPAKVSDRQWQRVAWAVRQYSDFLTDRITTAAGGHAAAGVKRTGRAPVEPSHGSGRCSGSDTVCH